MHVKIEKTVKIYQFHTQEKHYIRQFQDKPVSYTIENTVSGSSQVIVKWQDLSELKSSWPVCKEGEFYAYKSLKQCQI